MLILAIESSCDETSVAILKIPNIKEKTISENFYENLNSTITVVNLISSQIDVHKEFGGVIPELGAREHAKNINKLFLLAIKKSATRLNLSELEIYQNLSKIIVTSQPGLVSALRVGIEFAKSLQFFLLQELGIKTELKMANHLKGHIISCFYQKEFLTDSKDFKQINATFKDPNFKIIFPHLHLLVSGGNTQLLLLKNPKDWEIIGQTLDDAAGETLDKSGRMLGLDYPGGIWLAKIAGLDNSNYFNFPIGMKNSQNLDFSYSGLKTAVRYFVQKQRLSNWSFEKKLSKEFLQKIILEQEKLKQLSLYNQFDFQKNIDFNKLSNLENIDKNLILELLETFENQENLILAGFVYQAACSVQFVVVAQLIQKFKKGIKKYDPKSIGISGGVSANLLLRQEVSKIFEQKIFIPNTKLTGDNAVMIGLSEILD
jgi:N6-L-threonylcarbamoyladenine synthase